jgi:hypothetical protein
MMTIDGELITKTAGAPSITAIAYSLESVPRFGGHTIRPWSVVQHSLVVYRLAKRAKERDPVTWARMPLHALLHDAHESLTGDIPTSFKTRDMKELQQALDYRIYERLGVLPLPDNQERSLLAFFDQEALLAEAFVVCPEATYERISRELGGMTPGELEVKIVHEVEENPKPALVYGLVLESEVATWSK